jgi:hypothetical protein
MTEKVYNATGTAYDLTPVPGSRDTFLATKSPEICQTSERLVRQISDLRAEQERLRDSIKKLRKSSAALAVKDQATRKLWEMLDNEGFRDLLFSDTDEPVFFVTARVSFPVLVSSLYTLLADGLTLKIKGGRDRPTRLVIAAGYPMDECKAIQGVKKLHDLYIEEMDKATDYFLKPFDDNVAKAFSMFRSAHKSWEQADSKWGIPVENYKHTLEKIERNHQIWQVNAKMKFHMEQLGLLQDSLET